MVIGRSNLNWQEIIIDHTTFIRRNRVLHKRTTHASGTPLLYTLYYVYSVYCIYINICVYTFIYIYTEY